MSIAKGLKQLGFKSLVDFSLVQDSDGTVVIERWSSDQPQPSVSAIETAEAEWKAEQEATQYKRDRKYPPIGDQLDALFHAGVFPEEMEAKLQAVKDAHPKP
jgi:hypothetical protein